MDGDLSVGPNMGLRKGWVVCALLQGPCQTLTCCCALVAAADLADKSMVFQWSGGKDCYSVVSRSGFCRMEPAGVRRLVHGALFPMDRTAEDYAIHKTVPPLDYSAVEDCVFLVQLGYSVAEDYGPRVAELRSG